MPGAADSAWRAAGERCSECDQVGVAINPGTIQEDHWVTGVFLMTPTGQEPGEECGGP